METEKRGPNPELMEKGQAIFDRLTPMFEPEQVRKFIVIAPFCDDYEIDANARIARERLRARHPGAEIYSSRIGRPMIIRMVGLRMGGRLQPD